MLLSRRAFVGSSLAAVATLAAAAKVGILTAPGRSADPVGALFDTKSGLWVPKGSEIGQAITTNLSERAQAFAKAMADLMTERKVEGLVITPAFFEQGYELDTAIEVDGRGKGYLTTSGKRNMVPLPPDVSPERAAKEWMHSRGNTGFWYGTTSPGLALLPITHELRPGVPFSADQNTNVMVGQHADSGLTVRLLEYIDTNQRAFIGYELATGYFQKATSAEEHRRRRERRRRLVQAEYKRRGLV